LLYIIVISVETMGKGFLIGSDSARDYLSLGISLLREKSSILDVVEQSIRGVESNADDHGVGLGGIPNLLGVVQLDASFMDGRTRAAGAVASLEGFLHPITVARKVMEMSPHVLLVGSGAARFAEKMECEKGELLTEYSMKFYEAFKDKQLHKLGPEFKVDLNYLEEDRINYDYEFWFNKLVEGQLGTVNILGADERGDICSGVSTSGTYLKMPGRVGDSPIIGAGNYCDNKVGGAACTGRGELSIRHCTARTIVTYMKMGMTPSEACIKSMEEVHELVDDARLSCLAFNRKGDVAAASTSREPPLYYMSEDMESVEELRGVWIKK
jgi:beta-aspartyl-peptidase (threonine type)